MSFEADPNPEEKKQAWISWGMAGHSQEYVLNFEDYSTGKDKVPRSFTDELSDALDELDERWEAQNRGTRVEILSPNGEENPEVVRIVEEVLGGEYDLEVE